MASVLRGNVVLQPSYFTSSIYVKALRDDITSLIHNFHERYQQDNTQPFTLFKTLWDAQGWKWMHFKVFDSRTRDTFLNVTVRLFLERMVKTEAPFTRTVALFALYTFFNTQPSGSAPPLCSISHIPIPIDQYTSLFSLPSTLTTPYLAPLQPFVSYVVSTLVNMQAFHLLPSSELGSMNPRDLPREIYVEEGLVDTNQPQRKGHQTKRDKVIKARAALDAVSRWLEEPPSSSPRQTLTEYRTQRTQLLQAIGLNSAALREASQGVVERLREAQETMEEEVDVWPGLERLQSACDSGGMLRLLQ
ncbi:GH16 domain-containing protein [Favolaschia claudopus]|uniref:GH16 domain-containing protein n=1 Tax=Favolaschia claudopus TaxID=2862362 RepID=A0AAW0EIJ6_9AGAR